jgi:hypothetical protein
VFGTIKRELRRRRAIEPFVGRLEAEGHLGRCYLERHASDAANVVLTSAAFSLAQRTLVPGAGAVIASARLSTPAQCDRVE